MMFGMGLLSLLVWLPIAGGLVVLALGERNVTLGKWIALAVALATFVASLGLYTGFDVSTANYQFQEQLVWIPFLNSTYHLGVDGISMPLILLTIWMGVYPNSFLDPMAPAVDKLVGDYQAALKLARTAALAP